MTQASSVPTADSLRILLFVDARQAESLGTELARPGRQVAVASDLAGARELAARQGFDLAIVDYDHAGEAASTLTRELREATRPCLTILLAQRPGPSAVRAMVAAGAHEIVAPEPRADLLAAMTRTLAAARRLWMHLVPAEVPHRSPHEPAASAPPTKQLSKREAAVLRLIALGFRYQEIGRQLSISERTVKMHAANLRRKTRTTDRYELVQRFFGGQLETPAGLDA